MITDAIYVLSAALANFIVGGIWYNFFKNKWLLAWNLKESDINKKDPKPYLIAFIGSVWASYGMFVLYKHVSPSNYVELFSWAIGVWLLALVGFGAKHYAFAKVNGKAFVLDYLPDLIGIIIISLIVS